MRPFGTIKLIPHLSRKVSIALVGGAVGFAPTASVLADDIAASVVTDGPSESSVLVAKSKVSSEDMVADEEGLQPISVVAEKEPQLADPADSYGPEPASLASTESVAPAVKMAANTSEVESAELSDQAQPAQPAVFHGVQPGVTTKKQLINSWGTPDEVAPTESGQLLTYHLESFRSVEVLVEDGLVSLMKIGLRSPASPEELAEKVAADPNEAVQVVDEQAGRVAAYAYPERGIVMIVEEPDDITPESSERVAQMILQPLDSETFCLRAEQRDFGQLTFRIADLKQAVTLAPRDSHAHWLLSRALLDAGLSKESEISAKRAVDIDPDNIAYRQQWGVTLAAVGKYDNAVLITREVLDAEDVPTLIRSAALFQMGQLAAMGDEAISSKAVGFWNMAIAEADKLATNNNAADRRAAKRLLVESHLAIAIELSNRDYEDNMQNVAQWVSRASALAEELIANDEGDLGLRIRVAQQSVVALSHFKPSNDPQPLIDEINDTLEEIKSNTDDPLWIDQLEWTTGIAYQHALEIEHHRRRPKQALEYAEKAIELMADKAETRRDSPATELLVGKLYFHIGAVHAVHESDHAEAVKWYDRAFPLLASEGPKSELVVPRHEGEALVSMAVSYWDQNDRERAVSLTEMGSDLIEQAVSGGVIGKENLAVPYGNLAAMHKKLGNTAEAQRYAKLVDSVKAAKQAEVQPPAEAKAPGVAQRTNTQQSASKQASSSAQSRGQSSGSKTHSQRKTSNRVLRR